MVHFAGDAILAEFPTASTALSCAVVVQRELGKHNEGVAEGRRMQFRIGVNLGEVIVDRKRYLRQRRPMSRPAWRPWADPGGVCLSGTVFDAIGHTLPLDYSFLGEREVKNIDKNRWRAYQARPPAGARRLPPTKAKGNRSRRHPPRHRAKTTVCGGYCGRTGDRGGHGDVVYSRGVKSGMARQVQATLLESGKTVPSRYCPSRT